MSKKTSRILAGAAVAGAAVMGASLAPVGVADAAPLPGATKSKSVGGGNVTIRLYDESYSIQNSVANNHFSREVFVSGKVRVTTSGNGVKGGNINAGYIVGCQLNFGAGGDAGAAAGAGWESLQRPSWTESGEPEMGAGFELSPGEAVYVPVIKASDDGSFSFENSTGGVAYSAERFGVDGCAGYAQAMAKVTVKVSAPGYKGNVTMYGKPFSLG